MKNLRFSTYAYIFTLSLLFLAVFSALSALAFDYSGSADLTDSLFGGSCVFDSSGVGTLQGVKSNWASYEGTGCVLTGSVGSYVITANNGLYSYSLSDSLVSFNAPVRSIYDGIFSGVTTQVVTLLALVLPYAISIFSLILVLSFVQNHAFRHYSSEELDNADKWDYAAFRQGREELGYETDEDAYADGVENMSDVNFARHDDGENFDYYSGESFDRWQEYLKQGGTYDWKDWYDNIAIK